MGWFRRDKAETSRGNNYGQEYSNRPIVPPDALYPLINRTLDLVFNFADLGTRFMIQEGIDRNDHPRFSAVWQKEFSAFHASQLELQNAVFALQAVRVSDSESGLMPVHMLVENWAADMYGHFHNGADAFQAMLNGNKRAFIKSQDLADQKSATAAEKKRKLAHYVRRLADDYPEQFEALGLSENNLIDLDLEDLVSSDIY